MQKHKINLSFQTFSLQRPYIAAIIKKCIYQTLDIENITVPCEINILVTNDSGIQAVNRAYRDIDRPTDVLSFPMFQMEAGSPPENWDDYIDPDSGLCPLGDMVISLERAVLQAKEFGHRTGREVGYLTIHSMLHLLGYDHMDEGPEKALMRAHEECIAALVGLKR